MVITSCQTDSKTINGLTCNRSIQLIFTSTFQITEFFAENDFFMEQNYLQNSFYRVCKSHAVI